jgi:predicted Zn-dependent peptidase
VQTTLRMAASAPSRTDPDYAAFVLANLVFGGYFSSRWVANIREDKGYTYSPHAQVEHPPAGSAITLSADVSTPTTAAALLETVYELGRVATTPVSQAELDQARRYAIGVLALGTSSQAGLAEHRLAARRRRSRRRVAARPPEAAAGGHRSRTPSPQGAATSRPTGSRPSWSATSRRSRRRCGPSWTSRSA